MNLEELQNLIARGESETLEFKKTIGELKEGCQTACAMLNGMGGFVLFGVANNRRILGQDVAASTLETVACHVGYRGSVSAPHGAIIILVGCVSAIALKRELPFSLSQNPFTGSHQSCQPQPFQQSSFVGWVERCQAIDSSLIISSETQHSQTSARLKCWVSCFNPTYKIGRSHSLDQDGQQNGAFAYPQRTLVS